MAESALQKLLELSASLPNVSLRREQKEAVQVLAQKLNITLKDADTGVVKSPSADAIPEEPNKKSQREESKESLAASAREKFQKQDPAPLNNTLTRKDVRKSLPARTTPVNAGSGPAGNSDCDISSPDIRNAYDQVRNDASPTNWLMLGYGASKKALELYGSGSGGLKEFTSQLEEDEISYGYVRVIYGDSQRSKFVFISYVPEGLSGIARSRATSHKSAVTQFVKYMHVEVYATTKADLDEATVNAKIASAAGANYGTGGSAPTGSEDFGSVKDNARNFFQQTEAKGNRQSIVYNKSPLSDTTPVALQGRAGITEKYIKV